MAKCSICEDGHERYICEPCKADPANDGWFDGDPGDGQLLGLSNYRKSTKSDRIAAAIALHPNAKPQALAEELGVTATYVRTVAKRLKSLKRQFETDHINTQPIDRQLISAAWLEYRHNAAYQGGTGRFAQGCRQQGSKPSFIDTEPRHFERGHAVYDDHDKVEEVSPPPWFVAEELGFRFDCGPSLLDLRNARAKQWSGGRTADRSRQAEPRHLSQKLSTRPPPRSATGQITRAARAGRRCHQKGESMLNQDLGAVLTVASTNLTSTYTASNPIPVGRAKRVRFYAANVRSSGSGATTTTIKLQYRYASPDDVTITTPYEDLPSYLDDVQGSAQPKGNTREIEHAFTSTANSTTGGYFYLDDAEGIVDLTVNVKTNATGQAGDSTTVYAVAVGA